MWMNINNNFRWCRSHAKFGKSRQGRMALFLARSKTIYLAVCWKCSCYALPNGFFCQFGHAICAWRHQKNATTRLHARFSFAGLHVVCPYRCFFTGMHPSHKARQACTTHARRNTNRLTVMVSRFFHAPDQPAMASRKRAPPCPQRPPHAACGAVGSARRIQPALQGIRKMWSAWVFRGFCRRFTDVFAG